MTSSSAINFDPYPIPYHITHTPLILSSPSLLLRLKLFLWFYISNLKEEIQCRNEKQRNKITIFSFIIYYIYYTEHPLPNEQIYSLNYWSIPMALYHVKRCPRFVSSVHVLHTVSSFFATLPVLFSMASNSILHVLRADLTARGFAAGIASYICISIHMCSILSDHELLNIYLLYMYVYLCMLNSFW